MLTIMRKNVSNIFTTKKSEKKSDQPQPNEATGITRYRMCIPGFSEKNAIYLFFYHFFVQKYHMSL